MSDQNLVEVKKRSYLDEDEPVDGFVFIDCAFHNCTFVISGRTPPSFVGCAFDRPKFAFKGAASNTLGFLKYLASDPGAHPILRQTFPELFKL